MPIFPCERHPTQLTRLASHNIEYWIRDPPAIFSREKWVRVSIESANYVYFFSMRGSGSEAAGVTSDATTVVEVGDVLYN